MKINFIDIKSERTLNKKKVIQKQITLDVFFMHPARNNTTTLYVANM